MSLTAIILLIIVALILLAIEILFVPGMILGSISILMIGIAIFMAYREHGDTVGTVVLIGTAVLGGALTWWCFQTDIWKKVEVTGKIDSKALSVNTDNLHEGDSGRTLSRLAPMGKASIKGETVEVHSFEGFIDENREIEIVKISPHKIIVKLKTT